MILLFDLFSDVVGLLLVAQLRDAALEVASCRRELLDLTDRDVLAALILHHFGLLKTAFLQLMLLLVIPICRVCVVFAQQ